MSFGPAHTCIASNKRKPPGSRREHGDFVAQFHKFFPYLVSPHYPDYQMTCGVNWATWITKRGDQIIRCIRSFLQKELSYMYSLEAAFLKLIFIIGFNSGSVDQFTFFSVLGKCKFVRDAFV